MYANAWILLILCGAICLDTLRLPVWVHGFLTAKKNTRLSYTVSYKLKVVDQAKRTGKGSAGREFGVIRSWGET